MAHAAKTTLVTVERIVDEDFLRDDTMAAGSIPALYISGISVAENGAAPIGLPGVYAADREAIKAYVRAAKTASGFDDWAARHIRDAVAS